MENTRFPPTSTYVSPRLTAVTGTVNDTVSQAFSKKLFALRAWALAAAAVTAFSACGKPGSSSTSASAKAPAPQPPPVAASTAAPPSGRQPGSDQRLIGVSRKTFVADGKNYVDIDMQSQALSFVFDVGTKTTTGHSLISFRQRNAGRPFFFLDADIRGVRLNGEKVGFTKVTDPQKLNTFVALEKELPPGRLSMLEVDYRLPANRTEFRESGVGFITSMADLTPGHFLERWGPANFEEDTFALTVNLLVRGGTDKHKVFTNGELAQTGEKSWQIRFPANYDSSSFFVHLTDKDLSVRQFTVQGMQRPIPMTIYSASPELANQAAEKMPGLIKELEADYGPYVHPRFTAYISGSSGGMEYVGGALTSVKSLGHETLHQWFARGVMPADGRSGWIDEAIASWRDYGYQRNAPGDRKPTNLAWYSSWQRGTPHNAYTDGRALLAEWDYLLRDRGGLKPVLQKFFARFHSLVISTEDFRAFLHQEAGIDVDPSFEKYVYDDKGSAPSEEGPEPDASPTGEPLPPDSLHPTPLTEAELKELR
jgi:hypothetical protein